MGDTLYVQWLWLAEGSCNVTKLSGSGVRDGEQGRWGAFCSCSDCSCSDSSCKHVRARAAVHERSYACALMRSCAHARGRTHMRVGTCGRTLARAQIHVPAHACGRAKSRTYARVHKRICTRESKRWLNLLDRRLTVAIIGDVQ
jgi:hypothetical protein